MNLFFRYDLKGDGWRKNLSFTLNVDNLIDANPPIDKLLGDSGYTNGSALGRTIQLGIHKDF
jgi:iron complex outermembrane recepter protein